MPLLDKNMKKKECIEREAAIEAVTVWYKKACRPENMSSYNMGERAAYTTAISEIAEIPAADVRPVVTCADCKFWDRERISCEGLARCNTGESGIRYRNRNDFCSRGLKREES